MGMRSVLLEVAETYDEAAGTTKGVPAQDLLRSLRSRTDLPVPPGLILKGYGGNGFASSTPWIGVYDPTITRVPHEGLYLAYIFASDLASVTLTLQQGVTHLKKQFDLRQDLYAELERRASKFRRRIPEELIDGWLRRPQFKGKGWRPRAYEAASVIARRYDVAKMPAERTLSDELARMATALGAAAVDCPSREHAMAERDVREATADTRFEGRNALEGFKPKDGRDYIVKIEAHVQEKKQSHEPLILDFARGVAALGYKPITEGKHPRDLVLRPQVSDEGHEWLVEAKVVRAGNATQAVRECLAQLFEYRHFHYRECGLSEPRLVGLFSEGIGAYAEYLETHGVASVWRTEDGWAGSPLAVGWGVVPNMG